jgi:hypothetical protein
MRFKGIIMVLLLGLVFCSSGWAEPPNWGVFVPQGPNIWVHSAGPSVTTGDVLIVSTVSGAMA